MRRPEQELQKAAIDWLHLAVHHDRTFFFAVPNETGQGGKRGMILGKIRKEMGVVSGVPDILLQDREAGLIGLELKSANGRQTATQKTAQDRMEAAGAKYFLCRCIADIHNALTACGVPVRVLGAMI